MKKIYQTDPWLAPFKEAIDASQARILGMKKHIAGEGKLPDAVNNHLSFVSCSAK